jgi:RNA polymerase sigma-70 factor, ECF subfamily
VNHDSPTAGNQPATALTDDAVLAASLRAGDAQAYDRFVRMNAGRCLATARRMLGNEEDARDAVQETLVAVFRSIASYAGQSRLSTWLHRILMNMALMKLRSRRGRFVTSIEDLLPGFQEDGHHVDPPQPWGEGAENELLLRERRQLVREGIEGLPPAYREVLLLRDIEGLSTEETANVLSVTPNAVKIRLHRARQALRTLLDHHFRGPAA